MGGRRVRGLKARVGREQSISRGGHVSQVSQWRYTSWRSPKRKMKCW